MIEMLKKQKVTKILNDNTHVLGTWSEASDWVGQELLPQLSAAGVKYAAWIYSPSEFSQLSAQKSVDVMMNTITVQFFTALEMGKEWLKLKK